jgi:hypothetical protein
LLALFGPHAMSDWSPEFAPKRTSEAALVRSPPILHAHFLPDGQISKNLSSPFEKNIPLSPSGKSALPARPSFPGKRGGRASSRTWEGMRWTLGVGARVFAGRSSVSGRQRADERRQSVRQNRVVPTPVAGAKLSVASSILPDQSRHQAGSDGDKTNSSPGRARHKP